MGWGGDNLIQELFMVPDWSQWRFYIYEFDKDAYKANFEVSICLRSISSPRYLQGFLQGV